MRNFLLFFQTYWFFEFLFLLFNMLNVFCLCGFTLFTIDRALYQHFAKDKHVDYSKYAKLPFKFLVAVLTLVISPVLIFFINPLDLYQKTVVQILFIIKEVYSEIWQCIYLIYKKITKEMVNRSDKIEASLLVLLVIFFTLLSFYHIYLTSIVVMRYFSFWLSASGDICELLHQLISNYFNVLLHTLDAYFDDSMLINLVNCSLVIIFFFLIDVRKNNFVKLLLNIIKITAIIVFIFFLSPFFFFWFARDITSELIVMLVLLIEDTLEEVNIIIFYYFDIKNMSFFSMLYVLISFFALCWVILVLAPLLPILVTLFTDIILQNFFKVLYFCWLNFLVPVINVIYLLLPDYFFCIIEDNFSLLMWHTLISWEVIPYQLFLIFFFLFYTLCDPMAFIFCPSIFRSTIVRNELNNDTRKEVYRLWSLMSHNQLVFDIAVFFVSLLFLPFFFFHYNYWMWLIRCFYIILQEALDSLCIIFEIMYCIITKCIKIRICVVALVTYLLILFIFNILLIRLFVKSSCDFLHIAFLLYYLGFDLLYVKYFITTLKYSLFYSLGFFTVLFFFLVYMNYLLKIKKNTTVKNAAENYKSFVLALLLVYCLFLFFFMFLPISPFYIFLIFKFFRYIFNIYIFKFLIDTFFSFLNFWKSQFVHIDNINLNNSESNDALKLLFFFIVLSIILFIVMVVILFAVPQLNLLVIIEILQLHMALPYWLS